MKVVALVGCPNVGKSTLFNRLTKTRDALVADFPGLTRDRKYGRALFDGREYIVIDTGGIAKDAEQPSDLTSKMTEQALLAIEECDLVLFMVDARAGILPGDYQVAEYIRKFRGEKILPSFNCSNGYIYNFKKRNGFSSRKIRMKRRPAAKEEDIIAWKEQITELLERCPKERILNCDETSWKVYPGNLLVWAETGGDGARVYIDGDDKNCLTVLATVTATGTKLPLYFLASGKTTRVEETQVGDIGSHWKTHSESGWQTSETFQEYLMHLREFYGDGDINLVLDVHASHRTLEVKRIAETLGIHLWYIPPGCTDLLQPLDCLCFGALKSTARSLWRKQASADRERRFTKRDAVQIMIKAWDHLKPETIEEAWDVYDQ